MSQNDNTKIISQNRRARFNYEIVETMEAGIVLAGSEVKSLRTSKVNISDTYAAPENDEIKIEVNKAKGNKCPRCWKILENNCDRCSNII